jgi:hypothetical protein
MASMTTIEAVNAKTPNRKKTTPDTNELEFVSEYKLHITYFVDLDTIDAKFSIGDVRPKTAADISAKDEEALNPNNARTESKTPESDHDNSNAWD